jgi:hypothetical protein
MLLLGLLFAVNTCGKKDPPSLPKSVFPLKVLDLSGEAADDGVLLKGRILKEGKPEEAVPHVKGCRVYVARYSLENPPCEGCPLAYREVYGFGPEVMTDQGFMCRVPVRKAGQVYFFEVRLIGPEEVLGPPSNRVRVIAE